MASNRLEENAELNNEFSKIFENIEKIIGQCLMEKYSDCAYNEKNWIFIAK